MTSTSTPRTKTPTRPTISDEQYAVLLATRLIAGKAFQQDPENADVVLAKNVARREVRYARKVRNSPTQQKVLAEWNAFQAAKKDARKATRQAKRQGTQVA